MADKTKKPQEQQLKINEATVPGKKPSIFLAKLKRWMKVIVGILLLLCLIVGGFFLGVYLRVFDTNVVNEKLELYKYPVIGEYFVKPEKTDSPNAETDEPPKEPPKEPIKPAKEENKALQTPTIEPAKPVVLTKEEIDKQMKIRQAEEKKRISKLARLYEQMKPEDAVAILDGLNDDMVIAILGKMEETQVSKILVAFDADRSAKITSVMYNGKTPASAQIR